MALESYYYELINLYNNLRQNNESFLVNNGDEEAFIELINNRSVYIDDIELLRIEMLKELKTNNIAFDYESLELFEILKELPNHFPKLIELKNKLIESLKKLIESEKNINENMTNLKDELKKEINNARAGKKTLNAYKPTNGYAGSHFIDKTR